MNGAEAAAWLEVDGGSRDPGCRPADMGAGEAGEPGIPDGARGRWRRGPGSEAACGVGGGVGGGLADVRRFPTRRELISLGLGAFMVGVIPFVRRREVLVRRTVPVMGTLAEFAVVHGSPPYAHAAIDAAMGELRRVERLMTRFRSDSDVGRANLDAARRAVAISPETARVIGEALGWAEASDGEFDPCLARAVALWDVMHRTEPPSPELVRAFAGRRLYRALELDVWRGASVVRFSDADAAIDLGGIAKGYGVDRAVQALREWGIARAIVNVGGDLYALGRSDDGDPWRVGIRSPSDPFRLAGELEVEDRAVATSGDYAQFFSYRGERYHHLLDPRTGTPRRAAVHSVTVVADTCMVADAAATAVFGMAGERADRLLRWRAPGAGLVRVS